MKKNFILLLILVIGVITTACNNETMKNDEKSYSENSISYKDEEETLDTLDHSNSTKASEDTLSYKDGQIIFDSEEYGIKTIEVFYEKGLSPGIPTKYNSAKSTLKLDNLVVAENGWVAKYSGELN